MALSIEARIIAMLDSDHTERIPGLLTSHTKETEEPIKWASVDEFGQPILLRIVEVGDVDLIEEILKHVSDTEVQEIKYELFFVYFGFQSSLRY